LPRLGEGGKGGGGPSGGISQKKKSCTGWSSRVQTEGNCKGKGGKGKKTQKKGKGEAITQRNALRGRKGSQEDVAITNNQVSIVGGGSKNSQRKRPRIDRSGGGYQERIAGQSEEGGNDNQKK